MSQVAVLVDAGYCFQRCRAVQDRWREQGKNSTLDLERLLAELQSFARGMAGEARLLRIYWYDAHPRLGEALTQEHRELAQSDNVKLRLGSINPAGHQKEVDVLLVTDLVELARNGAISDAVLVSGDQDLRMGVELAQRLGVRVHLLGLDSNGDWQSKVLRDEADTTSEWSEDVLTKFLTTSSAPRTSEVAYAPVESQTSSEAKEETTFERVAEDLLKQLPDEHIWFCLESLSEFNRIPHAFDKELLATCRFRMRRVLTRDERRTVRREFIRRLRQWKDRYYEMRRTWILPSRRAATSA